MIHEIEISSSKKFEIIDINDAVAKAVQESDVKEGVCLVYIPHATAAVTINENDDPNIGTDLLNAIDKMIPLHAGYIHDQIDNNAAAHIKAAIIGPSETIPIHDGQLIMGTWQDIIIVDFDGPKRRKVIVKIING